MACQSVEIKDHELKQFVVPSVQLTEVSLGTGAYGSVEEVEIPGARVAAKKLHPQLVNLGTPEQVQKWVTDFVEECKLMSQLRHPHIVQFLGLTYLPGSQIPVLLMEKLQTSLDNLLETSPNIPLDVKVYFLTGVSQGVTYLHNQTPPIAHRDLTARNVLIDSGLTAKISDLGVARMVNIQPGELAATMTAHPGNTLYMPPEANEEEKVTRYNTAIDTFSFGVVSLFTLTQTFPKDLKSATYLDPTTQKIVGRSEIERREKYILQMKVELGEAHPLVKLTLDCLEYDSIKRPSTVEVLRRLEEIERTVPLSCTETKLELIRQVETVSQLVLSKTKEVQQIRKEHQGQLSERDTLIFQLQATNDQLQSDNAQQQEQVDHYQQENEHLRTTNDSLQAEKAEKQEQVHQLKELTTLQQQQLQARHEKLTEMDGIICRLQSSIDHLQTENQEKQGLINRLQAEKQEQVCGFEELTSLQQQQLEAQRKEIEQLTSKLKSLDLQARSTSHEPSQLPLSISFNWRRCRNRPKGMTASDQPIVLNEKLYVRGATKRGISILEYTPDSDHWSELPPPPVNYFSLGTLKGQLLLVGGNDSSTGKTTNSIYKFVESPVPQFQTYSAAMPKGVVFPAVLEFRNHLVIAGGRNSKDSCVSEVNVLDTTSGKWTTVAPLPHADDYTIVLIEETMCLIGQNSKCVLQANLPTLVSGSKRDVWKTLPNSPYHWSSSVAIDNNLLTVSGCIDPSVGKPTFDIQLYNPSSKCWMKAGELPEPLCTCHCGSVSGKLLVLGGNNTKSPESLVHTVYSCTPLLEHCL